MVNDGTNESLLRKSSCSPKINLRLALILIYERQVANVKTNKRAETKLQDWSNPRWISRAGLGQKTQSEQPKFGEERRFISPFKLLKCSVWVFTVLLCSWTGFLLNFFNSNIQRRCEEAPHHLKQSVSPPGCHEIIIFLIKNAMSQDKVFQRLKPPRCWFLQRHTESPSGHKLWAAWEL